MNPQEQAIRAWINNPRARQLFDEMVADQGRRNRVVEAVAEKIQQLRLDVKYLVFDLEATRRERDELKQRLEKYE